MKFFYIILCFLLYCLASSGCRSKDHSSNGEDSSLEFRSIKIDTLVLQAQSFSGNGYFSWVRGEVAFIDNTYGTVSLFNKKGESEERLLGLGEGPKETFSLITGTSIADDRFLVLEKTGNLSLYTSEFLRIRRMPINWRESKSMVELESNPKGTDRGIYEPEYMFHQITPFGRGKVAMHITTDHPLFNSYFTDEYYKNGKVLAIIDATTGRVDTIGVERPASYLNWQWLPNFDYSYSASVPEGVAISFELDSSLFVYDFKLRMLRAYGRQGREMNINYLKTRTFEEAEAAWTVHREQAGYFSRIYFSSDKKLLLRSYTKGGNTSADGLQIYSHNDGILLADFDVPKGFYVFGNKEDEFFGASVLNDSDERLVCYRFVFQKF